MASGLATIAALGVFHTRGTRRACRLHRPTRPFFEAHTAFMALLVLGRSSSPSPPAGEALYTNLTCATSCAPHSPRVPRRRVARPHLKLFGQGRAHARGAGAHRNPFLFSRWVPAAGGDLRALVLAAAATVIAWRHALISGAFSFTPGGCSSDLPRVKVTHRRGRRGTEIYYVPEVNAVLANRVHPLVLAFQQTRPRLASAYVSRSTGHWAPRRISSFEVTRTHLEVPWWKSVPLLVLSSSFTFPSFVTTSSSSSTCGYCRSRSPPCSAS